MINDDQVRQLINRMMGSCGNPETVLELMGVEFGEDKKLEGLLTLEQLDLFYCLLRTCDWCEQWRGVSDLNEQGCVHCARQLMKTDEIQYRADCEFNGSPMMSGLTILVN